MEQQFIIDSNSIIYYLGNQFPVNGVQLMNTIIDAGPKISVISKIEVLGFNATKENVTILTSFINDSTILELTSEVVEQTISLRKLHK